MSKMDNLKLNSERLLLLISVDHVYAVLRRN